MVLSMCPSLDAPLQMSARRLEVEDALDLAPDFTSDNVLADALSVWNELESSEENLVNCEGPHQPH